MIYFITTAIPEDFNISDYFTFRELANIADEDHVYLSSDDPVSYQAWESGKSEEASKYVMDNEVLMSIGHSIAGSHVTNLTSTRQEMFEKAISILEELGLVLYKRIDPNCGVISTRQSRNKIHHLFICVNFLKIVQAKSWELTLKRIVELEEYHAPPEVVEGMAEIE